MNRQQFVEALAQVPTVHEGTNAKIKHLKGEKDGDAGVAIIVVDLNANSGPTSSGLNIAIGTLGRNVAVPAMGNATFGLNVYRAPQSQAETDACKAQVGKAAELAALQAQIKAARAKSA